MKAIFKSQDGKTFTIPVVIRNSEYFLELDPGHLVPFTQSFVDVRLGLLLLQDDCRRQAVIDEINTLAYRLDQPDFNNFIDAAPDFRIAFDSDFVGQPLSRIIFHNKQISEFIDHLEVEKLTGLCGGTTFDFSDFAIEDETNGGQGE